MQNSECNVNRYYLDGFVDRDGREVGTLPSIRAIALRGRGQVRGQPLESGNDVAPEVGELLGEVLDFLSVAHF